jgi:hypothetical protein
MNGAFFFMSGYNYSFALGMREKQGVVDDRVQIGNNGKNQP